MMSELRQYFRYCLSLFILVTPLTVAAQDKTAAEQEHLSKVKNAIQAEKQAIKLSTLQLKKLQRTLRANDLAIARIARELNDAAAKRQRLESTLNELADKQKDLLADKKQQEQVLAKQLRTAYSSGHHDYLKLVLSQQNPSNVQRTLTYYQYLNDARISSIDSFQKTINDLLSVEQEQQKAIAELAQLAKLKETHQGNLHGAQAKRKESHKLLNEQLVDSKQRLAKLESEERALTRALAELQAQLDEADSVLKNIELEGLDKLRRKLSWPVSGKIANNFGSKKHGYLRWKGTLLAAPVGEPINTIHHGTVLFADWLKGYGLVIVVDHGKGYMSLYGHNQALLKNVGDRVESGEPIALVGQSGGQNQSGLYFEIRHQGKAQNPKLWCIN